MTYEEQFALQQRRNFLKFIGKAGVALPILQASSVGAGLMLARQAEAAGTVPRKIIFLHIPEGTPYKATETFTPSADLTLKRCSKPLETVKNECVFFGNMDVEGGGGHGGMHRVLGGQVSATYAAGSNTTIDLALASTVGATSPVSSLLLGVLTGGRDTISAKNGQQNSGFQDSPKAAFDRLFGGAIDASPIGNKRDKKIQDANIIALTKLKSKLGSYELARLDEHESAMNKLKTDIDGAASAGAVAGCSSPTFNSSGLTSAQTNAEFHNLFALQTENAILALRCNLTRVCAIQLGDTQASFDVPGNASSADNIPDLHGSVHNGAFGHYLPGVFDKDGKPVPDGGYHFANFRIALTEKVTYLINKLKTTDDGFGGKMIDSTLIVQVTDMSDGMSHLGDDAPFFLAGGGSAIKRGQVITMAKGTTHYRLLDTAAEYMGVYNSAKRYDSAGPISGILL